jgi:hypothetical protein
VLEVPGLEAQRFLRGLPRGRSKHPCWVVPSGRGLRLSSTSQADGVRVAGIERLRVLEKLARHAKSLRVFAERETGTAALELLLETARFHLVLSPDVWRGFSGEGQALKALAGTKWQAALASVRAALRWETVVDLGALANRTELAQDSLQAALSALGARGLVGFDIQESAYFHRELPFDLSAIEAHQPRLKAARKLLAAGQVRLHRQSKEECELYVAGTQVEHRVRLSASADGARCTCPWFSKYQGTRGPCKHILAVQMFLDATPETGER